MTANVGDGEYIRVYLYGLISRDCDGSTDPLSPEDKEVARKRCDDFESGRLRMVSLVEPGSIKYLVVDRTTLRDLVADGWEFGEEAKNWSEEEP